MYYSKDIHASTSQGIKVAKGLKEDYKHIEKFSEYTTLNVCSAVIGALISSIVSGVIWALIAIGTEREVGFIAIGVGLLAGSLVYTFSGNKRGFTFQTIAITGSVFGIILGKYFLFLTLVAEASKELANMEMTAYSYFSSSPLETIQPFVEFLQETLSPYDILWIALAVSSSMRLHKER